MTSKFRSKKLRKNYRSLQHRGRRRVKKHPFIIPIAGLFAGLLIVIIVLIGSGGQTVGPSDSHVVYLFSDGQRQVLPTRAQTVGELIQKLPLKLIAEDVVEPSLDTPILEDNFRVNIYRARPVTVMENNVKKVALTAQKSPRVVAQAAGVSLYPEDRVQFEQGDIKQGIIGEKVVINRSTPVMLNLYGTPLTVRTHAKTVNDLLKEKNVKLTTGDSVQPAIDAPIAANIQIFVVRSGTQIVSVEVPIEPPTTIVQDNSLSFGTTVVRQNGSPGKKAVTYQIQMTNGVETGRTVIQEAIIQDPVPKIVARGRVIDISGDKSSLMAAAGIASSDYGYVNYIVSRESGWCWTKWQGQVGYCPAYFEPLYPANSSRGYGLCQSTPGSKMASAGSDWQTNPITQLKWCHGYAQGRYGSWAAAYNYWLANHRW